MWSASASAVAIATLVAVAGCGPHRLDLLLTIDASGCNLVVPAGGSVLYQVDANGTGGGAGGGAGSFCGGCLAVDSPISGGDDMVAFLRTHAPSCGGVQPGTLLHTRLTGWSVPGCPGGNTPTFCADAPSQLVPDGTRDATLMLNLVCMAQCSAICVPTTCLAQGKNCGSISDGCNVVLDCGTCHNPQSCGGGGVPNVCGR